MVEVRAEKTAPPRPASCCNGGDIAALASDWEAVPEFDYARHVTTRPDGCAELYLVVENLHCPGCIRTIEGVLTPISGVAQARVNLTEKRLYVAFDATQTSADSVAAEVAAKGYRLAPYDPAALQGHQAREGRALLRALAVAGFAAANVMLLSVSVWSGLFSDMGAATRGLMHWVSALIAMPAVVYAGRPFFRSAAAALKAGRLNMDVPISLAVVLATAMSLSETLRGGEQVYFDAAVTLLFFLLIGRYLDLRVRGRARSAAENMLLLKAAEATVVQEDGTRQRCPAAQAKVGMTVAVAVGERIPVDGRIVKGRSQIDGSLVTGESLPQDIAPGGEVFAGTLNVSAPLELRVTATGKDTLLAEIVRLMTAAEQGRARYVRLADRVAEFYAPAVHLLALASFLGWVLVADLAWQEALLIAIAVLIITCPCALGLAVPAVQVAAVSRLLRRGVLVKAADGLERLAEIDCVVFDKTGTLTLGQPELLPAQDEEFAERNSISLRLAAPIAAASRHPLARALCRAAGPVPAIAGAVEEHPGQGLSVARADGGEIRLGNRAFCGVAEGSSAHSELWLAVPGEAPRCFAFSDRPRPDAEACIAWLNRRGLRVELLSGDRPEPVAETAAALGIERWRARCRPADKIAHLEALAAQGHKVLMVGDGLNDAPALAAAFVSASPAAAAEISQTAADFVLQGQELAPLREAVVVAGLTRRLSLQNFGLAFGYNALAVPLAVLGLVTPLFAAAAMSASSIAVTLNALRLTVLKGKGTS